MSRHAKIEDLKLGDEVIKLHLAGMTLQGIDDQIAQDHQGLRIGVDSLHRYIQKHRALINEKKAASQLTAMAFTLESIRTELQKMLEEVQAHIEENDDNSKAIPAFLRVKLDILDKMAKMLGAYAPDSQPPQINVAVGVATEAPHLGTDPRCDKCPLTLKKFAGMTIHDVILYWHDWVVSVNGARAAEGEGDGQPKVEEKAADLGAGQ